ncbi:MAG: lipoprotein signal peptidase [Bacteroidales bacterium]|nr:lipoprotein signal peptidase [Bacteroidales bacterium]MDT8373688.1 lipoprotein signal peptidase [Bacteroidales bacterium]
MSVAKKSLLLIFSILLVDQILKIIIKTNMVIGEEIHVAGNWFLIHFLENNGMAFGMEWGGKAGKIALSAFRMLAIAGISWYLAGIIRKKAHIGLVLSVSAIIAGAAGNLIDSAFYGLIFSESWHTPAVLFPEGGGYSSFLMGRVVDMFYFPIIDTQWPEWSPIRPGQSFVFFRPVFNIADASITTGVIAILLFQKKFLEEKR